MDQQPQAAAGPGARSRAWPPTLVLVAAIAILSLMDATIKHLATHNHVLIVTLGRYVVGGAFAWAIWLRAGRPAITTSMWRAHAVRGVFIAAAATTFFWSLTVLPLVEAVTLAFFYPLIVPFFALLVMGERVRGTSLAAAAIGFLGVIVAVQGAPAPDAASRYWLGVGAVVFSALAFAMAVALMRARARSDGAAVVGLLATLIPGLIVAAPAIALAPPPRLEDWPLFLVMGALAAGGMYLMAQAYAGAEAQQLAPIHYSELIWAALVGYFVFHEAPRPQVFLGATLIIAACLYAAYDERRAAPVAPP